MSVGSVVTRTLAVPGIHPPMADESLTVLERTPEDRDLLRRIRRGETDRYADLISRYQRHVVRIVGRRVPADHVEEVVHDVFVRAYYGLEQFSDLVSFDHWLAGIAVRTCYDFWRARKRDELPVSALTDEHQRWIDQVLATQCVMRRNYWDGASSTSKSERIVPDGHFGKFSALACEGVHKWYIVMMRSKNLSAP